MAPERTRVRLSITVILPTVASRPYDDRLLSHWLRNRIAEQM